MTWFELVSTLNMSIIITFVAFGVFLSFRILQFPDMTVDGSFTLGVAVTGYMTIRGYDPFFITLFSSLMGGCAGLVTAWLSTRLKILNLLSGILTMTGLYSINCRIMGPQIPFYDLETLFSHCKSYSHVMFFLLSLLFLIFFLLYFFLKTEFGLALRSIGHNPKMARANGINDHFMIFVGLALANFLAAFSGSLYAQSRGFSNITDGAGMLIYGLAAVIIGEAIVQKNSIFLGILSCFIGALTYQIITKLALNTDIFGLVPTDLSIITSILIASAMVIPTLRQKIS